MTSRAEVTTKYAKAYAKASSPFTSTHTAAVLTSDKLPAPRFFLRCVSDTCRIALGRRGVIAAARHRPGGRR